MIIIITGGTHTGKTIYAQKLLEKLHYPYLSVDHLKMGLIRSGYCSLTPGSGASALTEYLWPVVREIIKTAIENKQNLIVEGCYIPFQFQEDFSPEYLQEIRFRCLVFSRRYIQNHFDDIVKHACGIENRICDDISKEDMIKENLVYLTGCKEYGLEYALIDDTYEIEWDWLRFVGILCAASNNPFIPMNQNLMAKYLNIERSALSGKFSDMKRDGLIDYHGNSFSCKKVAGHFNSG